MTADLRAALDAALGRLPDDALSYVHGFSAAGEATDPVLFVECESLRAALAATPEPAPVAEGLDAIEAQAGRLLVEAARIRSTRLGPDDSHELRHLWAAINAGNSDPCGVNGESCHLDVDAIRRWTEQYPLVTGYAAAASCRRSSSRRSAGV